MAAENCRACACIQVYGKRARCTRTGKRTSPTRKACEEFQPETLLYPHSEQALAEIESERSAKNGKH